MCKSQCYFYYKKQICLGIIGKKQEENTLYCEEDVNNLYNVFDGVFILKDCSYRYIDIKYCQKRARVCTLKRILNNYPATPASTLLLYDKYKMAEDILILWRVTRDFQNK